MKPKPMTTADAIVAAVYSVIYLGLSQLAYRRGWIPWYANAYPPVLVLTLLWSRHWLEPAGYWTLKVWQWPVGRDRASQVNLERTRRETIVSDEDALEAHRRGRLSTPGLLSILEGNKGGRIL